MYREKQGSDLAPSQKNCFSKCVKYIFNRVNENMGFSSSKQHDINDRAHLED